MFLTNFINIIVSKAYKKCVTIRKLFFFSFYFIKDNLWEGCIKLGNKTQSNITQKIIEQENITQGNIKQENISQNHIN